MTISSEFEETGTIRIECIKLVQAGTSNYDQREELLQESEIISIYYWYVQTEVDVDAKAVKEALGKKNYRDN